MQNDKFAPKSYFFTDASAITQTIQQAFGPLSTNEFRVTSKFSIAVNVPAYAICKGVLFVQPQTGDSNKVNLVLKPFIQPIQGINIKYFVYRGLQLADFFNGDEVIATVPGSSDFITKINDQFNSFYANSGETKPAFLAKYIGYDPAVAGTIPLDSLFFKQSQYHTVGEQEVEDAETSFELPIIDAGKTLGSFVAGECGIDVVLNYGDYQSPATEENFVFDLAYARAAEASIQVVTGSDFRKKQRREQHLQFLDVAAYYGFHASTDKGQVSLYRSGVVQQKKGIQIYDEVLTNFHTKNKLYLYINSDRGRSYNFYNNYQIAEGNINSLKHGHAEDNLEETTYTNNDWPLLIVEQAQNHNENTNKLYLQLVTDNNANAMFYGQVAEVDNAQTNNFIDAVNLPQPVEEGEDPSIFTKTIILSNPAAGEANSKHTIATFNLLHYHGKTYSYLAEQIINEDDEEEDVYATPNFFDDVFGELQAIPLLKATIDNSYSSVSFEKLKLINHYYDQKQQGISAVQTVMVNDEIATEEEEVALKRVTYITEAVDVLNDVTSVAGSITARTNAVPSLGGAVNGNNTYSLPEPFYYTLQSFTDSTDLINGVLLQTIDHSIPDKIILGITKIENDELKDIITLNNLSNARIFLQDLFEDGNQLISAENILYQKYKVGVVGEKSDGVLELYLPENDIMVYSLDRNYHFSAAYSEFMKYEPVLSSLVLDLNLSL